MHHSGRHQGNDVISLNSSFQNNDIMDLDVDSILSFELGNEPTTIEDEVNTKFVHLRDKGKAILDGPSSPEVKSITHVLDEAKERRTIALILP